MDGLSILRFAHASGSGGGLERYLADLNRALGERNSFTTIQIELSHDRNALDETVENHNGCRVIKIPLFVDAESNAASIAGDGNDSFAKLKSKVVECALFSTPVYQTFTRDFLQRRKVPRRAGEPDGAGRKTAELIKKFRVDLIVLHSSGGADASEIIETAKKFHVPVALLNHFSNDRLAGLSMRQQISHVAGVAGVCGVDVPRFLRNRFYNLSDGIDTEFFRREKAQPFPQKNSLPSLLLPARITPAKGQMDLLTIAGRLQKRELPVKIIFAGRADSAAFESGLRQTASRAGLSVEFIGQLDAPQLRDWYAAANVLVFPTRHHEGLPRILMESQAMGLLPVVYKIGGTSEGILDRQTGFLVRSGDIEGMTNAVATILRDDSLRKKMAASGRKFAEAQFSLSALAERHEDFYLKLLSTRETREPAARIFTETKAGTMVN